MISMDTAITFFIINLTLGLIPCAEMAIVITQSTAKGWLAGFTFVVGICSALLIQVVLMSFGLTAIIQTSEIVFNLLKVVGVCYLLFLAWQTFTQPFYSEECAQLSNLAQLYRKGVMINISTPLTPIFLLLFIPQFIDIELEGVIYQSLQLGFLFVLAFFCVYTFYCIFAGKVGSQILQSKKIVTYLQRSAGVTIACFAVFLVLAKQSL